jgi:hypothetical protein
MKYHFILIYRPHFQDFCKIPAGWYLEISGVNKTLRNNLEDEVAIYL